MFAIVVFGFQQIKTFENYIFLAILIFWKFVVMFGNFCDVRGHV